MKKKIIINGQPTNYSITDDAHLYNDITGKELKGTYNTNEYHSVQLVINGQPKTFMFHRLVAEAFCDNPHGYTIVDHIDRNKHNDNANNLRWVTSSQNAQNKKYDEITRTQNQKYLGDFTEKKWVDIFNEDNYKISEDCEVVNLKTKNIMCPQDRHGYLRVGVNGSYKSLHILMWESFNNKKVPEGMQIDHIDGNKKNNYLSNLRIVDQTDNMINAYKNGHKGAVPVCQFDTKGNFIAEFPSYTEAAKAVNGDYAAIKQAVERKGTSQGYYWTKKENKDAINEILNSWVPEGYVIIKDFPTYCINEEGLVYNKRNKAHTPIKTFADGTTKYVIISKTRKKIDDLLKENFPQ